MLPKLLKHQKIGIIIIDSVAGIFRANDCDLRRRAINMRSLASMLVNLSDKYECAIICTNQIASFEHRGLSFNVPTLGLAWANLTNTRIVLSKNQLIEDKTTNSFKQCNKFEVKNSPYLKDSFCYYRITTDGVTDLEETN